jgi:hypothetical protein
MGQVPGQARRPGGWPGRTIPPLLVPVPGAACCAVCFGPTRDGFRLCYQCGRHQALAPDLADAVVPVSYAISGDWLAEDLWRYKSPYSADTIAAGERLRRLLLVFLHDHGRCVWRAAGMERPGLLAVVPSGRGRLAGLADHPLLQLATGLVRIPTARLAVHPGRLARGRDVDESWLRVLSPVRGQDVLVLDDSWVSGGSAQSSAVALKRAGARRVAVVVLGRHLNPADPRTRPLIASLPAPAPGLERCAVHGPSPSSAH